MFVLLQFGRSGVQFQKITMKQSSAGVKRGYFRCSLSHLLNPKKSSNYTALPKKKSIATSSYHCLVGSLGGVGSNHDSGGWLIVVDVVEGKLPYLDITLVNPFRKEVPPIHLPRLQFNHGYKYPSGKAQQLTSSKVILSGDPTLNPDSFLVLAINGHKNGHNVYSIEGLNSDWVYWKFAYGCTDAIVYKSQVYSITAQRCLNLLDVDKAITNRFLPQTYSPSEKFYLVESIQGYMLLVQRDMESKKNVNNDLHQKLWTNSFVVHKIGFKKRDVKLDRGKLVFDVEEPPLYTGDGDRSQYFKLFEVESIRDEVLFVGDNYSFSVLASDYPGCQPNSIYYTDDSMETPLHEGYSTYDCSDGRGRSFGRRGRGGYKGPQADLQLVGDAPYDMGIFNLADKSITPLCSSLSHSKTNVRPPFWTIPPFSGLC